jgi:hypothetical protein
MEIFINRIPPQCKERDLKRFIKKRLAEFVIIHFVCEKLGNKACAKLIFLEVDKGKRFLAKYGKSNGQRNPLVQLSMNGNHINLAVSKNEPDDYILRCLKSKAMQSLSSAQRRPAAHTKASSEFEISGLRYGLWLFINAELTFVSHFADSRRGTILLGHRQLALLYDDINSLNAHRIDINYFDVDSATTGAYESPTITFAVHASPQFYCEPSANVVNAFANLNLLSMHGIHLPLRQNKKRVASINTAHASVVSTCFVYQVQLADYRQLPDVFQFLK